MNKLKAMYGYWTHCIYSCDPDTLENYLKTNKTPPCAKFDTCFNQIEPLISSSLNNSASNMKFGSGNRNSSVFSDYSNRLASNGEIALNSSTVKTNMSVDLKELTEIWTVKQHPPNSRQVKKDFKGGGSFKIFFLYYYYINYLVLKELLQFQLFHDEFE